MEARRAYTSEINSFNGPTFTSMDHDKKLNAPSSLLMFDFTDKSLEQQIQ